jgi:hypothetical protein
VFKDEDMIATINLFSGSLNIQFDDRDDFNNFKINNNRIPEKIQINFQRKKYSKRHADLQLKNKQKKLIKYKNVN